MSSIPTKTFFIHEEIQIHSSASEECIVVHSNKSLSLHMDYSKRPIDWLIAAVKEWISRVEVEGDLYTVEYVAPRPNTHGGISIKRKNKIIANLILEKSQFLNPDGKKGLRASIMLRRSKLADEVLELNQIQTIYINDRTFNATHSRNGHLPTLLEVLEEIIPTRSEAKVKTICSILKISPEEIVFDSFQKRYIITTAYLSNYWHKTSHPTRFYKYVSIHTFVSMLKNQSFRMNSIIAQSDESESLYFGNYLCNEYNNEIDRLKGLLSERNVLVSCFTPVKHDSYMWEAYGDNGEGVMLEFESTNGNILTPVQYINEDSHEIKTLKENILSLIQGETRLYFTEIDSMHRFIKNDKFKNENEWRLIHEFKGNLSTTLYGNTLASYHDFPFVDNFLPELNLALISVTFGPNQRKSNIAQLIKETKDQFRNVNIYLSPNDL